MSKFFLLAVMLVSPVLLTLSGCEGMSASSTEPVLSAAGFRVMTPQTEEQRQLYAQLPAYKLQRGSHQGKVFYAYKDEKKGVAYVGNEEAYQRYQNLALRKSIAQSNRHAAMMNDMTASRWYGAYYRPIYY